MIVYSEKALRIEGSDLVAFFTLLDRNGVAFSGATVTFSVKKVSIGKYWNTTSKDFVDASEPGTLISCSEVSPGLYEYTLEGAYSPGDIYYEFHAVIEDFLTVDPDFTFITILDESGVSSTVLSGSFTEISTAIEESSKLIKKIYTDQRNQTFQIKKQGRINDENHK